MRNHKAPKHSRRREFPVKQLISDDRNTRRMVVSLPKGWRFDSLNTSEGQLRLRFKQVNGTGTKRRAAGYAGERQRLMRGR